MASLLLDDFSGGLNLRDSPNRIVPSESPGCYNFALTERGGLKRRNGHFKVGTLPAVPGKNAYIHWSEPLGVFIMARETATGPNDLRVWTSTTGGTGTWTNRGAINSDVTAAAAFVDVPRAGAGAAGPVCVITTDKNGGATRGTWYMDTTFALTQVTAGQNVAGTSVALWQDRVIVAGYPVSDANGNPTRVFATPPKDPSTFTAGWTNDIREKDANPITGMGVVAGAVVLFKKRSAYRVNDSATGAYSMIDSAVGSVNARAISALLGRLYLWAPNGIFECDGVGALRNVGDRLRPIYGHASTDTSTIIAGVSEDHVFFTGTLGATAFTGNTGQTIDYAPTIGGAVLHILYNSGQDQPTSYTNKDGVLYMALADGDALFRCYTETPGVDDATNTTSGWRMPWLLPNSGALARLQRLRIQGSVSALSGQSQSVTVHKDWNYQAGDVFVLDGLLPGASTDQAAVDIQALGHSSAFAPEFGIGGGAASFSIRAVQLITTELAYPNPGYPRMGASNRPAPPRPGPLPRPTGGPPPK